MIEGMMKEIKGEKARKTGRKGASPLFSQSGSRKQKKQIFNTKRREIK
jgi:hypothetical protein